MLRIFCLIASFISVRACQDGSITANPNDCSTYIQCDHNNEIIRPCPSGLLFNPDISACDWPANVRCGSQGSTSTTTTNAPTTAHVTSNPPPKTTTTTKTTTAATTADPVTISTPPSKTTTRNPQSSTTGPSPPSSNLKFAPYFDVNMQGPTLPQVSDKSSQKNFVLAFAIGSSEGCVPKWGGQIDLNDTSVINPIRQLQARGGQVIVATGGAMGPYFEHLCTTPETLANAYKKVLDAVKTNHLDVDIESTVTADVVNQALAKVQKERPETTVSFTLMVQAEDYGLTPQLGVDFLKNAKQNGVRVDFVNPMTMEFGGPSSDFGDSVIGAAKSVLGQMKEIWPEKSDTDLKKMLSVTPMIGRNYNGKIFQLNHAQKLVAWANANHIGRLHFWSTGRDNGGCAGGGVSPSCSSISQGEYAFIKIFQGFTG